ncbi:MAG: phosphatidylserine decarboxylase family protein [Planctomycetota bacterium]
MKQKFPLAPEGYGVILTLGLPLLALVAAALLRMPILAIVPGAFFVFLLAFFRDPARRIPADPLVLVSPADGRVTAVDEIEEPRHLGCRAVRVSIFLSIFNVHVNRIPAAGRVECVEYQPGKFLNAMDPDSARVNENNFIGITLDRPRVRIAVRQVAGLIARRIVCTCRPGDALRAGDKIGMIRFGSRTELYWPVSLGAAIAVKPGDKVHGGRTIIARLPEENPGHP